jgi:anaerobic selenocysteine-containing dehydrogenase
MWRCVRPSAVDAKQAGRLYVRELRLGKTGENPSARILRERRKSHGLGDHITTRRPGILQQTSSSRTGTLADHDLEEQGRLTHPMRWDAAADKYVPVTWAQAFEEIGRELRALDPHQVDFYTSGRASLETSYMYQLFARMYGSNNMPDSSNMCHESSSVALPESIGASVGTAVLSDFQNTDCIFYIAQNVGPRRRVCSTISRMLSIAA